MTLLKLLEQIFANIPDSSFQMLYLFKFSRMSAGR